MSNSTQTETRIPAFEHWVSNNDTLTVPRPPTPVRPSTYAQDLASIFGLALLVGMIAGVLGNIIQLFCPCRFLIQCLGVLLGSALIITVHPIGLFNDLRTQYPFLNTNRSFLNLMTLLCKTQNYDNDMNHFSSSINDTRLSLSIKVREAWYARGKGPDVINGVGLANWYKWFEQCEDTLCHLIWTVYSRQGIFALWARDADTIKLREHAEKLRWLGEEVLSRLEQRAEAQRKLEEAAEWEEAKVQAACKMAASQEEQRRLAQWRAVRDEYRLRTMAAKKVWQGSAATAQEKARIYAELNVNQEDAQITPQRKAVAEWLNAWEAKRGAQEAATWAAAKDEAARNIAARKPFGKLPPRGKLEAQILVQQQEATEWARAKANAVQNLAAKEAAGVLSREARDAQVLLKQQKEAALRWQDAANWAVAKADAARRLAASEKAEKQEAQRQKEASLRWQEAVRKLVASDKAAELQAHANAKAEHERRLKFREQMEVRKVEVVQRWAQYGEAEQKKAEQEDAARLLAEKVEAAEERERDMEEYVCV